MDITTIKEKIATIDYKELGKTVLTQIQSEWSGYKKLSDEDKKEFDLIVNDIAKLTLQLSNADANETIKINKEIEIAKVSLESLNAISEMYMFRTIVNITGKVLGIALATIVSSSVLAAL